MTRILIIVALFILAMPASSQGLPHGFLGLNTATWDSDVDMPTVTSLLKQAGIDALRFPGGSTSDAFDWTKPWATSTARFAHLAESLNADVTITINYGSGSPQMAAAWVAYCNALPANQTQIGIDPAGRDWKTAGYWAGLRSAVPLKQDDGLDVLRANHPKSYKFRNWEIGNECYGTWENDSHSPKQDPVVYAQFAIETARLMKSVDPKIRVGIVITQSEENYPGQESVINPISELPTSQWNAVLLSALSTHGFHPDFVIFHHYPQSSGTENDQFLLHDYLKWPSMVAGIRNQVKAFYPRDFRHIGIDCTECNSVSDNPGPQTVSDVNAQYYSQVAEQALKQGVESFYWWDLHNGHIYHPGQLGFGDYGILGVDDDRDKPYPVYDAIKAFHLLHTMR